jgi:hypothetical protein
MADTPCGNSIAAFSQKDLNPDISSFFNFMQGFPPDRSPETCQALEDVNVCSDRHVSKRVDRSS